eukprot:SAG11_NODE_5429_length_1563_cov_1.937158_2_plen_75_part_00
MVDQGSTTGIEPGGLGGSRPLGRWADQIIFKTILEDSKKIKKKKGIWGDSGAVGQFLKISGKFNTILIDSIEYI